MANLVAALPVGPAAVGPALKHGLYSEAAVLPGENPRHLRQLRRQMRASVRPLGAVEETLTDELVSIIWRLRRVGRVEAELVAWSVESAAGEREENGLPALATERLVARSYSLDFANRAVKHQLLALQLRLEHELHRTMRLLWQLQAARGITVAEAVTALTEADAEEEEPPITEEWELDTAQLGSGSGSDGV